jgi:hypothetical protein
MVTAMTPTQPNAVLPDGLAARVHRVLESLHAFVYFAPDADQVLVEAGLKPGRMTYFAGRSAAMGAVSTATVAATFYNFHPGLVARTVPLAWTLATPQQVTEARWKSVDVASRRLLGDEVLASAELADVAALAKSAAQESGPGDGRPLYAAHAALDWPTEPHLVLWHAATLLREHRGDGHIATLINADLSGLEALITHVATGAGFTLPTAVRGRGWSADEWTAGVRRLQDRQIIGTDYLLTESGAALRAHIENETDRLASRPYRAIGVEKTELLRTSARPLAAALVAAGAFPDGIFAHSDGQSVELGASH